MKFNINWILFSFISIYRVGILASTAFGNIVIPEIYDPYMNQTNLNVVGNKYLSFYYL